MAEDSSLRRTRLRPLSSYHPTLLGVAAVVVVAVLVSASLAVKMAGIGYQSYTAKFLQAASLRSGNPVTVAGIPVGSVAGIKLAGDHVEARLRIRDGVTLGPNTRAAIKITTILGSRYVELKPDRMGRLPARTIGLDHTEVPYDLQEALNDATTNFEQVDSDQVAASLQIVARQLAGLPPVVPQAMRNIESLSTVLARRRDQLGALLASSEEVTNTLRRQQSALGGLVNQGQDLIREFVDRRNSFRAIMVALTSFVDNLSGIVIDDRASVDELVTTLHDLTGLLADHDDMFRNLLQILPVPFRQLANATGFGNAFEFNTSNGIVVDSWACAVSGRAKQFNMIEYFKDCK